MEWNLVESGADMTRGPKKNGVYLVTVEVNGERRAQTASWHKKSGFRTISDRRVIAWHELTPYEGPALKEAKQ